MTPESPAPLPYHKLVAQIYAQPPADIARLRHDLGRILRDVTGAYRVAERPVLMPGVRPAKGESK